MKIINPTTIIAFNITVYDVGDQWKITKKKQAVSSFNLELKCTLKQKKQNYLFPEPENKSLDSYLFSA